VSCRTKETSDSRAEQILRSEVGDDAPAIGTVLTQRSALRGVSRALSAGASAPAFLSDATARPDELSQPERVDCTERLELDDG
jgi:hypothetical protein